MKNTLKVGQVFRSGNEEFKIKQILKNEILVSPCVIQHWHIYTMSPEEVQECIQENGLFIERNGEYVKAA